MGCRPVSVAVEKGFGADREMPVLPPWRGLFGLALRRGAASSGVILAYLTPFVVAFWWLGVRSTDQIVTHARELLTMLAAVMVFPPLAIPGMPVLYVIRYEWLQFSAAEIELLVPLAPWLLFWSYLAISHLFLQAAARV